MPEQIIHLGLGTISSPKLPPLFLNVPLIRFELVFAPRGGQRRAWGHQVSPFQLAGIQKGSNVGFPRFAFLTCWGIGDGRRVVLIRERGKVVSEFVYSHVSGPLAVNSNRGIEVENSAASVRLVVYKDFNELVRRV